jgi:branched-subunit amino acid aminotransferase/4-amino-4-deoxychorismate lyase
LLATLGIMSNPAIPRIEIDGRAATAEQLRFPVLVSYGHFTAMQVRSGSVRGLDLHLKRLDAANLELFGARLNGDRVRDHIRHALGDDTADASVRVYVFCPDTDDKASIMVTVRPPAADLPSTPQSLQSVAYQRPAPHIKHLGGFGQMYYGRLAERNGFDDALLTGPGGVISEGAIANIGFFDGVAVVWPDAPALHGITMQLLEPRLVDSGLPSRRRAVRLADLPSFEAVFVTNSHGVATVGRIDDLPLPVDMELMKTVKQLYESVPWDPI